MLCRTALRAGLYHCRKEEGKGACATAAAKKKVEPRASEQREADEWLDGKYPERTEVEEPRPDYTLIDVPTAQ